MQEYKDYLENAEVIRLYKDSQIANAIVSKVFLFKKTRITVIDMFNVTFQRNRISSRNAVLKLEKFIYKQTLVF